MSEKLPNNLLFGDFSYLNDTHYAINRPPRARSSDKINELDRRRNGGIALAIRTRLVQQESQTNVAAADVPAPVEEAYTHTVVGLGLGLSSEQKDTTEQLNQPLSTQSRRHQGAKSGLSIRRISSSNGSRSFPSSQSNVNEATSSAATSLGSSAGDFGHPLQLMTSMPTSPAVSFLSQLANVTSSKNSPQMNSGSVIDWNNLHVAQYHIGKRVGTGNFADVYHGSIDDGRQVAIKIVSKNRVKFMQGDQSMPDKSNTVVQVGSQLSYFPAVTTATAEAVADTTAGGEFVTQGEREVNSEMGEDELLFKELSIWKSVAHSNIIPLQDIIEYDHEYLLLVSEYCGYGNLLEYINRHPSGLDEDVTRYLFTHVAKAVQHLHHNGIVHRDLKAENVLLTHDSHNQLVAKLCDFSLSDYYTRRSEDVSPHSVGALSPSTSNASAQDTPCSCPNMNEILSAGGVGSIDYAAPEELDHRLLHPPTMLPVIPFTYPSPTADMWSLGVMLYGMLCNALPFHDDYRPRMQMYILSCMYRRLPTANSTNTQMSRINSANNSYTGTTTQSPLIQQRQRPVDNGRVYSEQVVQVVDQLLTVDVYLRLDVDQLLASEWLVEHEQQQSMRASSL